MAELRLETEFPEHDAADWRAKASAGLRGAPFESLVGHTPDGLVRGPLFDADARPRATARLDGPGAPHLDGRAWHVCAPVADADLAFANAQLLEDLKGGASAVRVCTPGVTRRADLKRLLEGVFLDLVPIVFAPGCAASTYAPGTEELYDSAVSLGRDMLGERPSCPENWRPFTIDAATVHEAGGDAVLELAVFGATLAEGLRRHGAAAVDQVAAEFATHTDPHLSAVKLRAARRVADGIAAGFGVDAALPFHVVSSRRMMQSRDAWTNLLRTQSAGLGAVWGGADFLVLRPFTEPLGKPTAFASRIARNQQLLMLEESRLGTVRDPAQGSYFHERLTEDMAQAAWRQFQAIEATGGIEAFRAGGGLDALLTDAQERREARAEPVLGVSLHAADDIRVPETRA